MPTTRRTITVEIKTQRGRVVIAGEKLLIEDAAGDIIQFKTDDIGHIGVALIEAETQRRQFAPAT